MTMRRGKEQHNSVLKQTIEELRQRGYKVIELFERSPSIVAVKDDLFYAYIVVGAIQGKRGGWIGGNRTLSEIDATYFMFDKKIRKYYDKQYNSQYDAIDEIIKQLEKDDFNAIPLRKHSPDAIATKEDKLYAIEILGMPSDTEHNTKSWTWKNKQMDYDMFDGLMIKTFKYGATGSFTETFGKQRTYHEDLMNCRLK